MPNNVVPLGSHLMRCGNLLYRTSLLVLLSILMLACGGGGGGSEEPPAPPEPEPEVPVVCWQAPTQRSNGEQLAEQDIAYYEIWYGSDKASLVYLNQVDALDTHEYQLDELPVGEHYIALVAVDQDGRRSDFSTPSLITVTD